MQESSISCFTQLSTTRSWRKSSRCRKLVEEVEELEVVVEVVV